MPVKITKRDYSEIFTTGTTNWLLGNVGEWQTLTIGCEVSVEYYGTQEDSVTIDFFQKTFKRNNGKSWSDLGFDIGQTGRYQFHYKSDCWNVNLQSTFTIVAVNGDLMEVSNMNYDSTPGPQWTPGCGLQIWDTGQYYHLPSQQHPYSNGSAYVDEVRLWANVEPEGCRVSYVHTTNDEVDSNSLNSVIDGTVTSLVQPNVKAQVVNIFNNMIPIGLQSGMSIRLGEVRKLGKKAGSLNIYKYEIKIQFLISSFFDSFDNILDRIMPEFLAGDNSFTDNFKLFFYPKWNNPNSSITNDIGRSERLGNTGWFDENFNELPNNYNVDSIQYFDENGNIVQALDYYAKTKVKIIVSGVNNVNTNTECGFGFIWLPRNEEDYKEKETPFYRNTFISNGKITDGYKVGTFYPTLEIGGGLGNASMNSKNVRFTSLGGGKIACEILFEPSSDFSILFDSKDENDRNYALWVSVADQTLVRNFSDRVSLLADINVLTKTVPLLGEYDDIQNRFIEHPYSENNSGVLFYSGFVQDDVLCRLPFKIDLARDNFKKMRFGIELYNPSTGVQKVLEKFDVDFTQFYAGPNGEPTANINLSRGFKLNNDNNKNWLKVNRDNTLDTSGKYGYLAYYAFKIRYEDWIKNELIPADFFNISELNEGFNNDWYYLSTVLGWQLNFFVEIDSEVNGELGKYKNQYEFKISDYDSNDKVDTRHFYYRDSDDTVLNIGTDPTYNKPLGVIISNEPTRIEVEFEIVDGLGTWDINNVYGVTTIEIDKGAGITQMRQLSSVWDRESDNPLIPISGENNLKLEVDSTNKILKTICLVDPTLLEDGTKYRITSRVGCFDTGIVYDSGKYEYRYEDKYE